MRPSSSRRPGPGSPADSATICCPISSDSPTRDGRPRRPPTISSAAFSRILYGKGHRYGTPRSVILEALKRGALAVFDIDVQGGSAIKRQYPEALRALVLPPSLTELERRLRARSTDDDTTIRRRLHAARVEVLLARAEHYEYWVVNEDLDRAYADLEAIVRAESCRAERFDLQRILE